MPSLSRPSTSARDRAPRRTRWIGVVPVLAALLILVAQPTGAAASWTPRGPTGDYSPHHVWQQHNNCVWAAGSMLLDKWTQGDLRVSQNRLRHAAKQTEDASSLADLHRGIQVATGISAPYSPGFGDSMTWWQLLDRLEDHGGAVLIGEYSRLPVQYSRWDPSFAARSNSSHAVYVERYDRANHRVWLMDPLATGDFAGEWIDVEALQRFATFSGDLVQAMATTARRSARTAPLSDQAYGLDAPQVSAVLIAGSSAIVRIGLTIDAGWPVPGAHRIVARWVPVEPVEPVEPAGPVADRIPPLRFPGEDPSASAVGATGPIASTTVSPAVSPKARAFQAAVAVPATPGRYRLVLGLATPGRSTPVRSMKPVDVEVVPPFAARWIMPATIRAAAGRAFALEMAVTNIGSVDWSAPAAPTSPGQAASADRTVMTLTWISPSGRSVPASWRTADVVPGATSKQRIWLVSPTELGAWQLRVDLVSSQRGSLAAGGSPVPSITVLVMADDFTEPVVSR